MRMPGLLGGFLLAAGVACEEAPPEPTAQFEAVVGQDSVTGLGAQYTVLPFNLNDTLYTLATVLTDKRSLSLGLSHPFDSLGVFTNAPAAILVLETDSGTYTSQLAGGVAVIQLTEIAPTSLAGNFEGVLLRTTDRAPLAVTEGRFRNARKE